MFLKGDITQLDYDNKEFDSAILNMGTIGNFDNKINVISELLRVARTVYFDFYPPTPEGLEQRRRMYSEEGWTNVRIEGKKVVSNDGLDSKSLSKKKINEIVKSIKAKVKYYEYHNFATMARIKK